MSRTLVALFVVFHIVAVAVLAIPTPGHDAYDATRYPRVVKTLDTLEAAGVPRTWSEWAVNDAWPMLRRGIHTLEAPFRPYARLVGARQSWRMFASVKRAMGRIEVDVHDADGWRPWFRMISPQHDGGETLLRHERIRTLVNRFAIRGGRGAFRRLVPVLADVARAEGVEGDRLRVRMRWMVFPPAAELRRTGALEERGVYWTEEVAL
ncbi:MAG: hypothetical protein AAF602_08985 [Myxococcota bacterium]